jgi:nucleoside-triphosphatase
MKTHRVFLTGEPGCGKTTAIKNIIQILRSQGLRVGGMVSGEIRENGLRVGFSLEDILTHATGILAHIDQKEGPHVGKYRVKLDDLASVGVAAIKRAVKEADVIVVDELGPMELTSPVFIQTVQDTIVTPKHLLGTIHKRASHPLVMEIKSDPRFQILDVTSQNRDRIPGEVVGKILS